MNVEGLRDIFIDMYDIDKILSHVSENRLICVAIVDKNIIGRTTIGKKNETYRIGSVRIPFDSALLDTIGMNDGGGVVVRFITEKGEGVIVFQSPRGYGEIRTIYN